MLSGNVKKHIELLIKRYPMLDVVTKDLIMAYITLEQCFESGHKLLIAGNGGSASDSEHIAGELMKQFVLSRPIPNDFFIKLQNIDNTRAEYLHSILQQGLATVPLVAHEALTTAFINDVDGLGVFAQQLYNLGNAGDVFLAISTSGNSENILNASVVACAMDIKVIGLTGIDGGKLAQIADIVIKAPETETFMVQELHLPIYHCICLMLEEHFFGGK